MAGSEEGAACVHEGIMVYVCAITAHFTNFMESEEKYNPPEGVLTVIELS